MMSLSLKVVSDLSQIFLSHFYTMIGSGVKLYKTYVFYSFLIYRNFFVNSV